MAVALGAATENQGNVTPHVHGVMAIVTPCQKKTLTEIWDSIEKDMDQFDRIKRFITHMCREDHSLSSPAKLRGSFPFVVKPSWERKCRKLDC